MSFTSATPLGPAKTETDIWNTPQYILDKLGGPDYFDLDPCQSEIIITNTAKNYYTEKENGLQQKWFGNVWCNPPYSTAKFWLEKMAEHQNGIMLIFVRSDTRAWQNYVKTATGINLINKRIKFLDVNGNCKTNGNAPSSLIAWGEENYQKIKNIEGIYLKIDK